MPQKRYDKQKILVTDDSEINRAILTEMLGDEYEIIEAENGLDAIAALQTYGAELSLVLLDIVMPEMDGFDVLRIMNQRHWISEIPVIMISSETNSKHVERCYALGASDFIVRPFDALIVHHRVVNTLLLYANQKQLLDIVAEQMYEKEKRSSLMIDILSHIVEFRNGESGLHVLHIRKLTELLLRRLVQKTDRYPFSHTDISRISTASALHDIGKIAIASEILNKPGRLTAEEFSVIKTHSEIGAQMLDDLPILKEDPLVKTAYEICRWHHERYDGKGYPDGLKGDEIPISAQIVSLADVYDALTSDRVYKAAYPHEQAVSMILNGECGAFNPLLLECMEDIADSLKEVVHSNQWAWDDRQWNVNSFSEELLHTKKLPLPESKLQLLEHERQKYNFFASMSEEVQFEYTCAPSLLTISPWGAQTFALPDVIPAPLHNEKLLAFLGSDGMQKLADAIRATTPQEPVMRLDLQYHSGNGLRWARFICRASWSADQPPQLLGVIGKAVDIHEARMRMETLERMASRDELTGLPNRSSAKALILNRLNSMPDTSFAIAMLDVDNFKQLNDGYGHIAGDSILTWLASQLRQLIEPEDIVSRVGGDEFLLFITCRKNAHQRVGEIFDTVTEQCKRLSLSVSMGASTTDTTGRNCDALFKAADYALYLAKQSGSGRCCFNNENIFHSPSALSPIDGEENSRFIQEK